MDGARSTKMSTFSIANITQKKLSVPFCKDALHFRIITPCHGRPSSCIVPISCGMKDAGNLISKGVVKAIPPHAAGKKVSQEWKLLDVRPQWEFERAYISDSLHVPLFIEDDDTSPITLLKRQIQFGFGGWWLGQKLTKENENFLEDVSLLVPSKDAPLLVACGEGLRSLVAVDTLHKEGYTKLAWLAGGLNSARDEDFEGVQGTTRLQFSTAGGVQGLLIKLGQYIAERK